MIFYKTGPSAWSKKFKKKPIALRVVVIEMKPERVMRSTLTQIPFNMLLVAVPVLIEFITVSFAQLGMVHFARQNSSNF